MVLGKRQQKMMINFRPHNIFLVTLGTIILWFGWLGFNGGSAFGANLRAVMACWNTCLTAMFAAITWVLLDWRLARKWSMVGWVCPPFIIKLYDSLTLGDAVLWYHFWTCCSYSSIWFHPALGFHYSRRDSWLRLQFFNKE